MSFCLLHGDNGGEKMRVGTVAESGSERDLVEQVIDVGTTLGRR